MKVNIVVKDGIYQYEPLEYDVPSVPRINDTIFLRDHGLLGSCNEPLEIILPMEVTHVDWDITKDKTEVHVYAEVWKLQVIEKGKQNVTK